MTEKRFTFNVNKNTIEFDGKFKAYVNAVDGFRIANLLNVLYEENQELRELLKIGETNAKDIINVLNIQEQYKVKANELEKENKELKEAMKRMMSDMMGGMR